MRCAAKEMQHDRKKGLAFTLTTGQVPNPPDSNIWADILRWLVIAMDPDDKQLHFASSCLAYALQHGGLTSKQDVVCSKIWGRVLSQYNDDLLICQNTEDETPDWSGEPF